MTGGTAPVLEAARDGLVYLPLGGAGEIGMNLYLYGCQGRWIAVECGVTFGNETTPGIDLLMADTAFVDEIRDDLLAIVLTHAHEDHQGALAHLWPRFDCPVYATAFTAGLVRVKLAETGLEREVPLREIDLKSTLTLGPFRIRLVTVTHSIPEPNALAIETPFGRLIHTGDWKIDPEPLIGEITEEALFRQWGDAGVAAMICDSTNVFVEGESGSEARIREGLTEAIAGCTGRVAVACFASNIARIESIAHAARANGRDVALIGRSLWRLTEIARNCGYLGETPPFLTEYDAGYLPRSRLALICTGSQGEAGSALERISYGDHPSVVLEAGDTVMFSSRRIPGNEREIFAMQDRLARMGVNILTDRDAPIHVSGHPARGELKRLYDWVRPALSVPMHGETRHLIEHAAYARALGVAESIVVTNGHALKLAPGKAEIVGEVPTGRLGLDGNTLVPMDDARFTERKRMNFRGLAFLTVALDGKGRLAAPPEVSLRGFGHGPEIAEAAAAAVRAVESAFEQPRRRRESEDQLGQRLGRAVRLSLGRALGKKPVTEVHVLRV